MHTPPDGPLRTLMSWERSAISRCQCAPCSAPPTTTLLSAALSALQCQHLPSQNEPLLSNEDLQQPSGTPATCSDIFLLAQCLQRHTGSPLLPCAAGVHEATLTRRAQPIMKKRLACPGQVLTVCAAADRSDCARRSPPGMASCAGSTRKGARKTPRLLAAGTAGLCSAAAMPCLDPPHSRAAPCGCSQDQQGVPEAASPVAVLDCLLFPHQRTLSPARTPSQPCSQGAECLCIGAGAASGCCHGQQGAPEPLPPALCGTLACFLTNALSSASGAELLLRPCG